MKKSFLLFLVCFTPLIKCNAQTSNMSEFEYFVGWDYAYDQNVEYADSASAVQAYISFRIIPTDTSGVIDSLKLSLGKGNSFVDVIQVSINLTNLYVEGVPGLISKEADGSYFFKTNNYYQMPVRYKSRVTVYWKDGNVQTVEL